METFLIVYRRGGLSGEQQPEYFLIKNYLVDYRVNFISLQFGDFVVREKMFARKEGFRTEHRSNRNAYTEVDVW